jgi:DNA-binding IclR family transcriptional regulator
MQQLANASGCVVSLAAGDTHEMIYLDRCGGSSMPYFFSVGSAVEMARTAIGRAYLAGLSPTARQPHLDLLAKSYGAEWPSLLSGIEKAADDVAEHGFCLVDQSWRRNIRSIAAPLVTRDKSTVLAIGCVTPAHAMTGNQLMRKWGAHLYHIVDMLAEHL